MVQTELPSRQEKENENLTTKIITGKSSYVFAKIFLNEQPTDLKNIYSNLFLILCSLFYLHVCLCKDVRSPGTGVPDRWKLQCVC